MKDIAKLASLKNTEERIAALSRQQSRLKNQATRIVSFTGHDPSTGKAIGTTLGGGTVYFDLESNVTPAIGQIIEVAVAQNTSYGRGDLRPAK